MHALRTDRIKDAGGMTLRNGRSIGEGRGGKNCKEEEGRVGGSMGGWLAMVVSRDQAKNIATAAFERFGPG